MSRKGENIYKRKDNRWEARYIKGYNADGTARLGYCYAKSYKEAKAKLTEAKTALALGSTVTAAAGKKRFEFNCDEWLRLNCDKVKESTYVKYRGIVENHIKPGLGLCTVREISSVNVQEFSHKLLFEDGLSPKTVKDILLVLNAIIKYTAKQIILFQSFQRRLFL